MMVCFSLSVSVFFFCATNAIGSTKKTVTLKINSFFKLLCFVFCRNETDYLSAAVYLFITAFSLAALAFPKIPSRPSAGLAGLATTYQKFTVG